VEFANCFTQIMGSLYSGLGSTQIVYMCFTRQRKAFAFYILIE